MKAAAVFALRVLVLIQGRIMRFMIAITVAGMAHAQNTRARAAAGRVRIYPDEPDCPFWHSRDRVGGALLPVRILRGLAESRAAPVLLRNNGVKEPLPDNGLFRDGNAVDAGVSVRKGTPVGAIRVSRGQDVEHQED